MTKAPPLWTSADIGEYYDKCFEVFTHEDLTKFNYHYGLVGEDKISWPHPEPLDHARHQLVHGLDLRPGMRVLDAGCGMGINSFDLAEETGAYMVGLTNAGTVLPMLKEKAKQRDVDHLCEFHHGDFNDLQYPDCYFDAVLNHESFCHVHEKEDYLRGIYRVLKPGGRWQSIDFAAKTDDFDEAQQKIADRLVYRWRLASLASGREILRCMESAGFVNCIVEDKSPEQWPYLRDLNAYLASALFINAERAGYQQDYMDLVDASFAWEEGLKMDAFAYLFLSGMRPHEQ